MPTRFSNPGPQYFNGSAQLSSGKLYFYENDGGSLTLKDTYSDVGLSTANTNPVILDATGRVPDIFLDGQYRVILQNSAGVQIEDWLDVGLVGSEGAFSNWVASTIYSANELVLYTDGFYYKSLQSNNQNKNPSSQAAWWSRVDFINWWNTNVTYPAGVIVIGSNGFLYTSVISTVADDPTTDNGTNWKPGVIFNFTTGTYVGTLAIAQGGTGQATATAAFDALAPTTTQGDTIYHNGTDNVRLAKGTALQQYRMNAAATAPEWAAPASGGFTVGAEVATTSGTSVDITGMPAGTNIIHFNFVAVSTSGTSIPLIQLGDAGGFENSGYTGVASGGTNINAFNAGFGIYSVDAVNVIHGTMILTLQNAATFTWAAVGNFSTAAGNVASITAGTKSLSAELTQIRLTTAGGADTFDAGAINVTYS